jgi:sugar phosphate permease
MASEPSPRPTRVRYGILALATCVAVLLYVDRYCLSITDQKIKDEVGITQTQLSFIKGAFFFTYALGQIPFGWLSDRYGPRRMLSFYIFVWSIFTTLLGIARGFWDLLVYRLGCGLFEAGAYPACAGIVRRWMPLENRGFGSGVVSMGGRIGGAVTPKTTAVLLGILPGWRWVISLFGTLGLAIAGFFWWFFRDSPRQHRLCNQAEAELIAGDEQPAAASVPVSPPWYGALTNASLWTCSFVQFGINFAWVLLINDVNRYFLEVYDVPEDVRGTMGTLIITISLPGAILGGWLTDWMTRRLGTRWGRSLPLVLTRFLAVIPYCLIPFVNDPWLAMTLMGLAAFCSDLGLPALWAYNMDVGGRNVGFVLGWGNMWGNFGAALSPVAVNAIVQHFRGLGASPQDAWSAVFYAAGAVFFIVGVASFWVDATKLIHVRDEPSEPIEQALADDDDKTELLVHDHTEVMPAVEEGSPHIKANVTDLKPKRTPIPPSSDARDAR